VKFFAGGRPQSTVGISEFPAISLVRDNWDDFGTKSQFEMWYVTEATQVYVIGRTKILHREEKSTELPVVFEELNSEYISLGQDLMFYKKLINTCGSDTAARILESLNDISWSPPLAEPFETRSAFRNSLLRENNAQKARRLGQSIILGETLNEEYSFDYSATIPGAKDHTISHFELDSKDPVPGRVVGIIGRNATGKTQYLSSLAKDLVHIRRMSEKSTKERDESFSPQRPLFNRIIAVSYSAFDQFSRPSSKQTSYVYCGIRNERGALSKSHLVAVYRENLARIKELNRSDDWLYYMKEILEDYSDEFEQHLQHEISNSDLDDSSLSLLSSGQAILANFITSLVAWICEDSLVLFDEPETHLHPNAVSSLFNVLNKILKQYDSYSILATHSPVVVQEIPRKRVIVFERNGYYTTAKKLPVETFGESVSELTRHVFETVEVPSYYRNVLKSLSRNYSFEEVMKLFEDKLSMNAQSFLLSQYKDDSHENVE